MANIKPKKKPTIKKGEGIVYNPATFAEYVQLNFIETDDPQYIIDNLKPLELHGRKFITFDTETYPHYLNSHDVPADVVRRWVGKGKKAVPQDYPFSIQVCDGTNAYCIYDTFENNFAKFKALAPIFEDPTIEKIAHNNKFDMHQFANAGLKIVGKIHDTVVLAKLVNENRLSFALRDIAAKKPRGNVTFEYMVDNYKTTYHITSYRDIPRPLLTQYGCADVWNAMVVFVDEFDKLEEDGLTAVYEKELEGTIVLYAMERIGMRTDRAYEKPLKDNLQKLCDDAEQHVYDEAGHVFNMNSGQQLYKVLIEAGVDPKLIETSEAGNPVLDKDAMKRLGEYYDISMVNKVLEYKQFEKLLNTYAVGIYGQADSIDRVHCSVNQTEATTGRMSITKPALQTLPKKDKRIRKGFLPPTDDYTLYFMDLDQVEYRLFAHYAQAIGLIDAIKKGYDVHAATAAMLFNKPIEEVTDEERQKAKTINFSLVYGQGDEATAQSLKMTIPEARAFKEHYFARIPEARPFINSVNKVIKQRGFVKNYYGRRRRLTSNEAYKAPNALIQGCAADYIKNKMVDMYKFLRFYKYLTQLIMIVHDELLIASHANEEAILPVLHWLMSDFEHFRVPITAGVDKGCPSWGEKEAIKDMEFTAPDSFEFLTYNMFDGHVFDIKNIA